MTVNLALLSERLRVDRLGSSLQTLQAGARSLGFDASAGRAKDGVVDKVPLPAIAHLTDSPAGHFVVVYRVTNDRVTVADPARGVLDMSISAFRARWSGGLLLLTPAETFRKGKPASTAVGRIVRLVAAHRHLLAASVACALVIIASSLMLALSVRIVVDRVVPNADWSARNVVALGAVVMVCCATLAGLARQWVLAIAGRRIELQLGLSYVRKLLSLPLAYFERQCNGDLMSRVNDVETIARAVTTAFLFFAVDGLLLLSTMLLLCVYNAQLAVVVLAFAPVSAALSIAFQRPLIELQRKNRTLTGEIYNHLAEALVGIRAIKAFAAEPIAFQRFEAAYMALRNTSYRQSQMGGRLNAGTSSISSIASVALLWAGAGVVLGGTLSVGQMLFFYSLLGYVLGPIERLAGAWPLLQDAVVGMERLSDIDVIPSEDEGGPTLADVDRLEGAVEFRDVSFGYTQTREAVANVSVAVPTGGTLVILGQTGCGKTTLANLLLGLYECRSGAVLLDGRDIRTLRKRTLRKHIGLVYQDPTLMAGTVRENIALGRPEASAQAIEAAARLACAHEFITGLPRHYDYDVGEGGTALSGGQRQRIAIARALLVDPAILVLDEATGNLDVTTEHTIMETIRAQRRGRTTIIITHRLNNVRSTDTIVVLAGGRVVEVGRHAELFCKGGHYAHLWSMSNSEASLAPVPSCA